MMIDSEMINVIARKEALLNELVVWLRAKGLYEEAMRDCPSRVTDFKDKGPVVP